MSNEAKVLSKMKPRDAVLMSFGEVIGAGVFSMTGVAAMTAGPGIGFTFLLAGIAAMLLAVPHMVTSSALPSVGGRYLYVSRFISPAVGFVMVWNFVFETMYLAVLGKSAGQYLPMVMPFLSSKAAGVICVALIIGACLLNIQTSAKFNSIMVVLVLVALILFVILGIPNMENFSFKGMFTTTGLMGIIVAVSYVRTACYGAIGLVNMSGEIENPRKTVPFAIAAGTMGSALLYAFVGVVAVHVVPWQEMANQPLSFAAETFMSPFMLGFFVIGGALFAILTTLVAFTIHYSRVIWAAANDGFFPKWFAATNRFGVPHRIIIFMGIAGIVPIMFDLSLVFIFSLMNAPGMLVGICEVLPALVAPSKLPDRFENAWFRVPKNLLRGVVFLHIAITLFFSYTLFTNLNLPTIIGIVIFYGAGVVYFFMRANYLKKNEGVDLRKQMSEYDPSWLEATPVK